MRNVEINVIPTPSVRFMVEDPGVGCSVRLEYTIHHGCGLAAIMTLLFIASPVNKVTLLSILTP